MIRHILNPTNKLSLVRQHFEHLEDVEGKYQAKLERVEVLRTMHDFFKNAVVFKVKGVIDTEKVQIEVGGKSMEVLRPESGMVNIQFILADLDLSSEIKVRLDQSTTEQLPLADQNEEITCHQLLGGGLCILQVSYQVFKSRAEYDDMVSHQIEVLGQFVEECQSLQQQLIAEMNKD